MVTFDVYPINDHITGILGRFHERMYLVRGRERAALIDTGCGFGSLKAVVDQLNDLPLMVLLTHGHQDHAMGAVEFDQVYLNPEEKETLLRHSDADYRLLGLAISRDAKLVTPADMLPPPDYERFHPVREGDVWRPSPVPATPEAIWSFWTGRTGSSSPGTGSAGPASFLAGRLPPWRNSGTGSSV